MTVETTQRSASALRTTAFAGLAATALVFGGQGLIQIGGVEPPFDAPAVDIANFFATRNETGRFGPREVGRRRPLPP